MLSEKEKDCLKNISSHLFGLTEAEWEVVIGKKGFYGFDKITKVEIHSDVNYLGVYAFSDCENLEEVIFEENSKIAVLSKGCFSECRKLRIFNTPENIYSIEDYAFQYCYQLTSFVIPASVNIMSYYAFNYCYNLNLIFNNKILCCLLFSCRRIFKH